MNKPLALIIEDDIEIGKIYTLALQEGFEVESFNDGKFALDRLQQVIPRIIILDLNMPLVSGREILLNIRAETRLASTVVILATADAVSAVDMQEMADIILIKPISPIQLQQLAMRLCSME